AAVIVAGLATASYRMVGPLYGAEVGLTPGQIGLFLACFVAGGAVAQYPAGWLADRYDRRYVLIFFSAISLLACGFSANVSGVHMVLVASALFGFVTFPIFSIASAHAHDFAKDDERVELSAALIFYYAVGAIAAPVLVSRLIDVAGPNAFFAFIAMGHAVLAIYGLWRMRRGSIVTDKTAYVYAPRTSFTIGRLMKRLRKPME
ncbi:MAG: MFS transporter, partial [Pseudomonadota bacterium]